MPVSAPTQPESPAAGDSFARVGYRYRPGLDGVRALAVLVVVAYHLAPDALPGGFLGVDVFFVLSGYLIAGLLLAEHAREGRIGLGAFWVRRARRLLPALAGVLGAVAVYAAAWAPTDTLGRLRGDAWATVLYVANWRFALSGQSYAATTMVESPLKHAWSLAVEEQFYLLFPLLVLACCRGRRPARTLGIVSALGALASAGLMAWLVDPADPSFVYYSTHTRAHALLVGVVLACLSSSTAALARPAARAALQTVGFAGLAAVLAASRLVDFRTDALYRGGFLVAAIAVAAIVAAAVRPGPVQRLLALAPLRAIGARSYGIYLWHWPAIVVLDPVRTGLDGPALATLRIAVTLVATELSYRSIEQPIRSGALRGRRFAVTSGAIAGTLVVALAAATTGATTPAFATGIDIEAIAPEVVAPGLGTPTIADPTGASATSGPPAATTTAPTATTDGSTTDGGPTAPPATDPPVTAGVTDPPTTTTAPWRPATVAVIGDSVAASAMPGFAAEASARGVRLVSYAVPGCGVAIGPVADDDGNLIPWTPDCAGVMENGLAALVRDHDPDVVVWWSGWEAADRIIDGEVAKAGTAAWTADLDAMLELRWRAVTAGGARVVLVDTTPNADSPVRPASTDADGAIAALRARLDALAARHPDTTTVVELSRVLCPDGVPCPREIDGVVPRPNDGGHFTEGTAGWVVARLWPLTEAAWRRLQG